MNFELSSIEKELSYQNPKVFSELNEASGVKRSLILEKLKEMQNHCIAMSKLRWVEHSLLIQDQLQQVLNNFSYYLCSKGEANGFLH